MTRAQEKLVHALADRIENDGAKPADIAGPRPGELFILHQALAEAARKEAADLAYNAMRDAEG